MYFREHTKMKMIDIVTNVKYAAIYTQCVKNKGRGEKMETKRAIDFYT